MFKVFEPRRFELAGGVQIFGRVGGRGPALLLLLHGRAVDCGHYIAEERPEELLTEIDAFFTQA